MTASAQYGKTNYKATLLGPGADGKPARVSAGGDTRPSVLRDRGEAGEHAGWAGQTVSLGMAMGPGLCRLLVNGSQAGELAVSPPAGSRVSVKAKGVTLRAVRVLPGLPSNYTFLSGMGVAMLSGGSSEEPATGVAVGEKESAVLEVAGVPMLVQGAEQGLAAMDVSAERWNWGMSRPWCEGNALPIVPVPPKAYSAAYLLIRHAAGDADTQPAMGFGLRVKDAAAADLKNICVADVPVRRSDEGVTVEPVPELGKGWFLARVPLNPAAMYWQTHDEDGKRSAVGASPRFGAYITRPWSNQIGLPLREQHEEFELLQATPHPEGKPSALRVAAITLEEAGVDLRVEGNGLGNVYCQPEEPKLTAVIRNVTAQPVTVKVTTELIPFELPAVVEREEIQLGPGEEKALDALAGPVRERGHYKVRVVADAGAAGRSEWRTNVGLLAPDTRRPELKADSPFGIWSGLWGANATQEQRKYLKDKAGVVPKRIQCWNPDYGDVLDDAKAEEMAKAIGESITWVLLGWEQNFGRKHTFTIPRVITEGKPEELSPELNARIDRAAETWRKLARAVRKHRPDLKIALGNSAVNFSVPFLERGFKPGVEFDYFGTEEGLFSESPEQPSDSVGNVMWWAKAVCEHFGHKNVPLHHAETHYYSTGMGLCRMAERDQAGYYVRAYTLGFAYDSVYGMSGAMVDSSNTYIYSIWGTSGYCNIGPECSPKLSYVAYATMTQLLDGAKYDGKLDAGTTSVYALRFKQPDGAPLYAIWNLRGSRKVTARLAGEGEPVVVNAVNRPLEVRRRGDDLLLTVSDMPLYVRGVEIEAIEPGQNLPIELPERKLLSSLEGLDDWQVDTEPDPMVEKPGNWMGMPYIAGNFELSYREGLAPPETGGKGAMTFTQEPLPDKHGLLWRYILLTAKPGKEIAIPKGTTRLGVWVHGNSTWAKVKFGVVNAEGNRWLLPDDKQRRTTLMHDNFDGWRFLQTELMADEGQSGRCKVDRILIIMPEQQVYVDDLVTTKKPEVSIWGLCATDTKPPAVNYLPW